jgi:hypothetical protein
MDSFIIAYRLPSGAMLPFRIGNADVHTGDKSMTEKMLEHARRQDSSVDWKVYRVVPIDAKLCEC